MNKVRMTEYSHGSGCGCKIAPAVLDIILQQSAFTMQHPALLVGHQSRDDAAVYDLGNGTAVISTTDFFMPIVDDAFTFGQIAATNAISDIYAMGGKPLMAIAIFGWPLSKLSPDVGREVVEGGRKACQLAGIPLAGGHSIDSPEPIFGLAVTGLVPTRYLKQNNTAQAGDKLFLTKPLGIGILTTAQKRKVLLPEHEAIAIETMCQLNVLGEILGALEYVHALTDVTGFGLAGHLREMCEGSDVHATVEFARVPLLPHVMEYLEHGCSPGGAARNFESYGYALNALPLYQQQILCDPQTSGGLLVAVDAAYETDFQVLCAQQGVSLTAIGALHAPQSSTAIITVV